MVSENGNGGGSHGSVSSSVTHAAAEYEEGISAESLKYRILMFCSSMFVDNLVQDRCEGYYLFFSMVLSKLLLLIKYS